MGLASAALILALGAGSLGVDRSGWNEHIAAHYSKGLMDRVAVRRGLPVTDCMLASPLHPIGAWVEVWGLNTNERQMCQVVDTSQPRDRARHIRTRLVELRWESAALLCGNTTLRNDECPVRLRR